MLGFLARLRARQSARHSARDQFETNGQTIFLFLRNHEIKDSNVNNIPYFLYWEFVSGVLKIFHCKMVLLCLVTMMPYNINNIWMLYVLAALVDRRWIF